MENILIEADGIYWHGKNKKDDELNEAQLKVRKNEKIKNKLAKKNDYHLVRYWEDQIHKKEFEEEIKKIWVKK